MRVLTFTSLFPSEARPRHGIFVKTRLSHLLRDAPVDARVIAPVPWFPLRAPLFGEYARYAATPRRAVLADGLQVSHPRYVMLPKAGMAWQPDSMARSAASDVEVLLRGGWQPELIDSHYLYPDGVAAAILAERFGLPFVMTARGTDVNVIATMPGPRARIRWAAERAAAVVVVSSRLREGLVDAGVDAAKITVLRNGVDTSVFHPEERALARSRLGLGSGRIALCVGNLVPAKGFDLALRTLALLPTWQLVITGEGPARAELEATARALGVSERVTMRANMAQSELRHLYGAADALLLTSIREGWPNVVLESIACGTPVVGVDVGAVGEMLNDERVGRVVSSRDPQQLAAALVDAADACSDRDRLCRHAAAFDWTTISRGQHEIFTRAIATHARAPSRERLPHPASVGPGSGSR